MTTDRITKLRAFYAAMLAGDLAAVESHFAADRIVIREAESLPYGGAYRGIDGFRQLARRLGKAWTTVRFEDFTFAEGADCVMVKFTMTATSRATGAVISFGVIEMFEMDGDKIISVAPFYWDTHALRAPLGIA
jgi:uncharacterized protein